MTKKFDLIVIGSGPGGARAAVQAAKVGKRVAIVENAKMGGSCVHTGTIPSKSLREAALAGASASLAPVMKRMRDVVAAEAKVVRQQLARNKVEIIKGTATFKGPHEIAVGKQRLSADYFVVATGTRPLHPEDLSFKHPRMFDSDGILGLKERPKRILILGAGVIGCEYASIFAELGSEVYLLDRRKDLLRFIDAELVANLRQEFDRRGVRLILGADLKPKVPAKGSAKLEFGVNGKVVRADAVLVCLGRTPNTAALGLASLGVKLNERGFVEVDPATYRTSVPHIFAVGDVIGPPALAAASAEQGRIAACTIFGLPCEMFPASFPTGIYTIPEISSVGMHEAELVEKKISYVAGRAFYRELARGLIVGEESGFVKLLVDQETHKLLGIHAIGAAATELIHIGQIVHALDAKVEFLVSNVFNYPTFAEAYKVAALNALNKLRGAPANK